MHNLEIKLYKTSLATMHCGILKCFIMNSVVIVE